MKEMERRRIATQKTLDTYRKRVFDWDSETTCVHLARDHLTAMGHTVPEIPHFTTAIGALRALKENGWDSVEDMLDSLLTRIPPSMMRLGDLATVEGQDGVSAIIVSAGPLKLMGWHPDSGEFVIYDNAVSQVIGAWRV